MRVLVDSKPTLRGEAAKECKYCKGVCYMGVKIDFTGVEAREFEPLPVGRYFARVSGCTYVEASQRSGEPAVAWEFTVEGDEYDGRKGFMNTSLQPQARWSTKRILKALGVPDDELEGEFDFEPEDYVGRECVIVIGHETYEGEKRQRVRRVLASDAIGSAESPF